MRIGFVLIAVAVLLFTCWVSSSEAEKVFGTVWVENYVPAEPATSAEEDWAADAKKAKCYLCHVKGKSKKYCNTYGDVLAQWLKSDNYEKDRIEEEEELVKKEILAALEKAEAIADVCGTPFGELFESGKLPNSELGTQSAAREQAAEVAAEEPSSAE